MSDSIKDIARDLKNYLEYQKTMGASEMPICENSNQRPITSNQKSATDNQGLAAGMNNQRLLDELRDEIGDCKRCRLCEQRTNVVFGVGNPNADLMFVGEGPGRDEDKQGIPFVGRAGQLLTKIIEAMKIQRSDVYIANVVKCLRYNAMVQMGNGKWERIGRLVKHRYKGTVKSIDTNGKIVNKRVVGWHATELGSRKVYKMSFKSARPAGPYKCAIQLTHNHPVLTKRGYVEVQNLQKKDLIAIGQGLSKNVKDIVYGMLLGDGHITKRQSYLSFSHSVKQEDYAKFKIRLLHKELNCSFKHYNVSAGFKKRYPIIQCYTSSHRSLRTIRSRFYDSNNTKIVPQSLAEELTPMTLAIWFMDDGYMRIRPNRQPSAEIATCAFKPEDIKILSKGIKKLGIENYIRGNRIFFNVDFTKKLSKTISPYVPPSMRWKLHPDIRSEIPFNRKLYSASEPETFFDQVIAKKVFHHGTDKTFYCIDVEDTNNFVTAGGVVHNCRPPENRNPAPDEIKICMPFLMKQIDTIKPKIIVCLGTFGAQTILNTEEKISMLRGKIHNWNGIKVLPTYHPAFLLRNPAMKRPVWDDMQIVIKELGLS